MMKFWIAVLNPIMLLRISVFVLTDKQSVEIYLDGGTILCTAGHTFGEERTVHVSGLPEGASLTVRPVCL